MLCNKTNFVDFQPCFTVLSLLFTKTMDVLEFVVAYQRRKSLLAAAKPAKHLWWNKKGEKFYYAHVYFFGNLPLSQM
jgi:hypothetical protein